MTQVAAYTKSGNKKETAAKLNAAVFGVEPNHNLLGLAYRAYLANGRTASAKTLTRGEVRGGGKKPWRQKGTGRARAGSSRIPHWTGGGVAFGPTGEQNYTVEIPTKMKRAAIRQALSLQATDKKLVVIEAFDSPEGKVKPTLQLLDKLKADGSVLIVVEAKDGLVDRATRNIPGIKAVEAKYVNVFDILNADLILISQKSLDVLGAWLGEKSKPTEAETSKTATKAPAAKAKAGSTQ
jgi:large subunit ribosomal protein L4